MNDDERRVFQKGAEVHADAHRVYDVLLRALMAECHERPCSWPVLVHATEILASFVRRGAKDQGATKDDVQAIRGVASECADQEYAAARADLATRSRS